MPFHFSLQALLRLRRTYEQRERMRLTLLNTAFGRLRHELEEMGQQKRVDFEQFENRLRLGMMGSEFRMEAERLERSASRQHELQAQMDALHIQVRQQTDAFLKSQRKRKILDSLRERELRAFEVIENRQEQQRIDDLFVQHRAARQGG